MAGFFYNLGKKAGPKVRRGKWIWKSLTGTKDEAIAAEYAVGCDIACEIRKDPGEGVAAEDSQLVCSIGKQLYKSVANKDRKFNFDVIVDSKPNAYAVAGGFVFVTTGMLDLCHRNRDEMAFVLAHEMAHIIRGHSIERLMSSTAFSTLAKRLPGRGAVGSWVRSTGLKLLESAYSQQNETVADQLGTRLGQASGYDTDGAVTLMRRLGEMCSGDDRSVLGVYFSTHPPFDERIANIKETIAGIKKSGTL